MSTLWVAVRNCSCCSLTLFLKLKTSMMKKSVFEIATERMITLLESGTNPWRKTWSTSTFQPPMNYTNKRIYSGINFFLLSMFENPYWMTYKQIIQRGGNVKKGAKTEIVFYWLWTCLLYTSPSPRDATLSRMPSSA